MNINLKFNFNPIKSVDLFFCYHSNLISELYKVDIVYKTVSSNLVNSAYTPADHEKIASNFDLGVGELLLLEAPNLYSVLVGANRSIFFPSETSKHSLTQSPNKKHLK